jgi:hypothetical protein
VIPTSFSETCACLDAGELSAAKAHASAFARSFPEAAEAAILTRLVNRRCERSDEAWLESLLSTWREAGKPTSFAFLRGEPIDQFVEGLWTMAQAAEDPDEAGRALALANDREFASAPLIRFISRGWLKDGADSMAWQAIASAPQARTTLNRLWIAALLESLPVSVEVADEAVRTLRAIRHELYEQFPDDFSVVATKVLSDGWEEQRALSAQQIRALLVAVGRHRERLNLFDLYRELVSSRGAQRAEKRAGCFHDACVLLPDPFTSLKVRAEQSLVELSGRRRDELIDLLLDVGEKFRGGPTLLRHLSALELTALANEARGDEDGDQSDVLAQQQQRARYIGDAQNRLSLDWPIEKLQREVWDAWARDGLSLMERTAFPQSEPERGANREPSAERSVLQPTLVPDEPVWPPRPLRN